MDPTTEIAVGVCWDCQEVVGPTHSEDVGHDLAQHAAEHHDTELLAKWEEKPYDEKERIVQEILGDVEVWMEAPGPNGPWFFESLTVRRGNNFIFVDDVDGNNAATWAVQEIGGHDEPAEILQEKLEELNEESLSEL